LPLDAILLNGQVNSRIVDKWQSKSGRRRGSNAQTLTEKFSACVHSGDSGKIKSQNLTCLPPFIDLKIGRRHSPLLTGRQYVGNDLSISSKAQNNW